MEEKEEGVKKREVERCKHLTVHRRTQALEEKKGGRKEE